MTTGQTNHISSSSTSISGRPTEENNNQPPQQQLNATVQQSPIQRIDQTQPNERNNELDGSRKRITILLVILLSLGIGQTIHGHVTNNDKLISDGVYGTVKAFWYALFTLFLLIGAQQMNQR